MNKIYRRRAIARQKNRKISRQVKCSTLCLVVSDVNKETGTITVSMMRKAYADVLYPQREDEPGSIWNGTIKDI